VIVDHDIVNLAITNLVTHHLSQLLRINLNSNILCRHAAHDRLDLSTYYIILSLHRLVVHHTMTRAICSNQDQGLVSKYPPYITGESSACAAHKGSSSNATVGITICPTAVTIPPQSRPVQLYQGGNHTWAKNNGIQECSILLPE